MNTNKETQELCKTFNRGFNEIEKLIMDWGRDNKKLDSSLQTILALDYNPRYPKGYGGMSAGNYLLSLILTDPKAIKKLHTKHEAVLTAKANEVLSFWGKHPGFWCYFAIKEILEDDFLTIVDLIKGEEHLLYSPGICSMQKKQDSRNKHYLCLMLGNRQCLQTSGILRYNSLPVSDFLFYCDLFDPEEPLDTIINKHYIEFFALDEISTIPGIQHRGHSMLYTWQEFSLDRFDITTIGGVWNIQEKDNLISYALNKPDESMMDVPQGKLLSTDFPSMSFTLYRDTTTATMAINTAALASYTIIASLLKRSYPELALPKEPEVAISIPLYGLVSRMDLDLPWSKFKTIIDFKKEKPVDKDMAKMNDLLKHLMEAQNTGKAFDAKAYSKRSGLALEVIEGVIATVQDSYAKNMPRYEVPPEDAKYELSGWPVPPPTTRRLFSNSLVDSDIFEFDEGPNTIQAFNVLTGGQYNEDFFDMGLLEFIEILFLDAFDDYRFTCMLVNTLFWILFHKGKEWLPVRSYAIEMLKLFPHPIQEAYPDAEQFIEEFSTFTKKYLCTRGICSLSKRPLGTEVKKGAYVIKGSDAFFSLVEGIHV